MRRRLLTVVAGGVAALALVTATSSLASAGVQVTATDNQKTLKVPVNATVVLTLKSPNSHAGYYWRQYASPGVKLVKHHYVPPKHKPGAVGASVGKDVWLFKVVGPKKAELQFKYVNPAKKVDQTFVVKFTVG